MSSGRKGSTVAVGLSLASTRQLRLDRETNGRILVFALFPILANLLSKMGCVVVERGLPLVSSSTFSKRVRPPSVGTHQTTTPRTHASHSCHAMDDSVPPPLALNPLHLQVQTSPPPVDRGVYTSSTQTIPAGTLVEQSPVLVFSKDEWEHKARHTLLQHYTFVWGKKGDMALALGMG